MLVIELLQLIEEAGCKGLRLTQQANNFYSASLVLEKKEFEGPVYDQKILHGSKEEITEEIVNRLLEIKESKVQDNREVSA